MTWRDLNVEVGPHFERVLIVGVVCVGIVGLLLVIALAWVLGQRIAAWRAGAKPPPAPWRHGGGDGI